MLEVALVAARCASLADGVPDLGLTKASIAAPLMLKLPTKAALNCRVFCNSGLLEVYSPRAPVSAAAGGPSNLVMTVASGALPYPTAILASIQYKHSLKRMLHRGCRPCLAKSRR